MSDERRKINKQSTGTVPKTKYRNITASSNGQDNSRCLSNNLLGYWHHSPDSSSFIRNPRRNNYILMDAIEDSTINQVQNGAISFNQANGTITPNTSASTSRRNSSGSTLKCDNVTKYPDKKQIEDKLHQIREYLKITNSLMTSMKNSDDQIASHAEKETLEKMMSDLKDSEKKLVNILDQMNLDENMDNTHEQLMENGVDTLSEHSSSSFRKNDLCINLDNPNQELDALKDQQLALMRLQQKAENKLRDARKIQCKLLTAQYENDVKGVSNLKDNKNSLEQDFDNAFKELEDRAKRLRPPGASNQKIQDNILAKVEILHSQIVNMHNANDEREQLIETLDNRDAELQSQHVELQNKLIELQNKKLQVDKLVAQLHSFGEDEEDDVGGQVKKIVTMKDQIKKLKDMLEIVKTTENIMQNTNASIEPQAACDTSLICENFLEKDVQKPKKAHIQTESNVLRYGNDTSILSNDSQPKEVNKKTRDQSSRGVKSRTSINEKLVLQAELEAKKKEVEAIMGKHKASTSNLNHDVGADIKSEFSCTSNAINEAWLPLISPQNQHVDSDRFSSDEGQDDNVYSELQDNHNILSLASSNYSPSNTSKYRFENNPRGDYISPLEFDGLQNLSRNSERNLRSSSVATTGYIRGQPRSNSDQDNRNQVQKQLHLIKSVCDSMLEQQTTANIPSNVQQLRNNLTPSLHSEPHRFASPNPHSMNALNVVNPPADVPCFPINNMQGNLNSDMNYQNWLSTNTIQTQTFMMNTLNQCCQMLWLQQRELMSLRNVVTMLQEKMENNPYGGGQDHLTSPLQSTSQDHRSTSHYRPIPNPKLNPGSAAFSLPNLNHYSTPPSNLDPSYINQNNIQSGRLLDPLNNVNVNHLNPPQGIEHANNILHGVNSNINHTLPNQMWNGQALNNQVAPGNRANNYWDNFRSYSRQNLFSTKNSEVLQSTPSLDRSNTINERTNPFTVMPLSKSNSGHGSASTSQENTPQRRVQSSFRPVRHENTNSCVIPPPDVLNVNHNVAKINEQVDLASCDAQTNNEDISLGFQMLLNLNGYNDTCSNHSNVSEHIFKECNPEQSRSRNEWCEETQERHLEEQQPKTKLFEELRENVYKEVATLISANETRPHFLIQLFRDLQLIGSDSLRLKILQSIQMVITQSLILSQNFNRLDGDMEQTAVKGALPFLNDHEDEIIEDTLLISLKQILLGSDIFRGIVKDAVFQKHFSNVLDEVLEQYHGKKVCDVKLHLVQTINDLLCGELSFIQLIQETNSENYLTHPSNDIEQVRMNFPPTPTYDLQNNNSSGSQMVDGNIQNGDLAEADQTRVLDDDTEEEGAVGGLLEPTEGAESNLVTQVTCDDVDLVTMDFSSNVEGLDQVPTRLPTKVKSRSPTPNRD